MTGFGLQTIYLISGPIACILALGTGIVVWRQVTTLRQVERAWVIPSVEVAGPGSVRHDGIKLLIKYVNSGKTPAFITSHIYRFDVVSAVPPVPDFRKAGSISDLPPEPIATGQELAAPVTLLCNGWDQPGRFGVICGVFEYRDSFNKKRKSTWGYRFTNKGELERLGAEYNRYT